MICYEFITFHSLIGCFILFFCLRFIADSLCFISKYNQNKYISLIYGFIFSQFKRNSNTSIARTLPRCSNHEIKFCSSSISCRWSNDWFQHQLSQGRALPLFQMVYSGPHLHPNCHCSNLGVNVMAAAISLPHRCVPPVWFHSPFEYYLNLRNQHFLSFK